MKHALDLPLALILWGTAWPGLAQDDTSARLLELEARVQQLTRRVDALEALAQAGMDTGPGVRTDKDLVWHFDRYLAESPFAVSQQELDRKTGQVDLLLSLAAEPADADLWREVQVGGQVPVEVEATLTGGVVVGPVSFTLYRRTSFRVGSQVHLLAQLPVSDPKAIRRLTIGHARAR
jgi:hypothetical protein